MRHDKRNLSHQQHRDLECGSITPTSRIQTGVELEIRRALFLLEETKKMYFSFTKCKVPRNKIFQ